MDQLTLSERVARLENILVETGVAGDRNASHPEMGIRDKTDRWDDEQIAAQEYQQKLESAQREYNRRMSGEPTDKTGRISAVDEAQMQRQQTAFEEIIQRISSCNDRVCLTADKLQKIGDRIMGALPEGAHAGDDMCNTQRSPDGTLDHTFMALNWLDASLSRLEQVALRMERV